MAPGKVEYTTFQSSSGLVKEEVSKVPTLKVRAVAIGLLLLMAVVGAIVGLRGSKSSVQTSSGFDAFASVENLVETAAANPCGGAINAFYQRCKRGTFKWRDCDGDNLNDATCVIDGNFKVIQSGHNCAESSACAVHDKFKCLKNGFVFPKCCATPEESSCADSYELTQRERCMGPGTLHRFTCSPPGHDAFKCLERGVYDKDCCALESEMSCANSYKLTLRSLCYVGNGKDYFNYICSPPVPSYRLSTSECTAATRLLSQAECQEAYNFLDSQSLFQYQSKRKMWVGNDNGVPKDCSIQFQGNYVKNNADSTPHWNSKTESAGSRLQSGEYRAICKGGLGELLKKEAKVGCDGHRICNVPIWGSGTDTHIEENHCSDFYQDGLTGKATVEYSCNACVTHGQCDTGAYCSTNGNCYNNWQKWCCADGDGVGGLCPGACPQASCDTRLTINGFDGGSPPWAEGREYDKAWDGDTSTFYDYKYREAGWTQGTFESATQISRIRYLPRQKFSGRMVGGIFAGIDQNGGRHELGTIVSKPTIGWSTLSMDKYPLTAFAAIRYEAPSMSNGNVAEIQVFGGCGDHELPDTGLPMWTCANGEEIYATFRCDGNEDSNTGKWPADCSDGSDEDIETCCAEEADKPDCSGDHCSTEGHMDRRAYRNADVCVDTEMREH